VQDQIYLSLKENPRKLTIIYMLNAGQKDTFANCDWLVRKSDEPEMWENVRCVVYESLNSNAIDQQPSRWAPPKPPLRKLVEDLGMRAAGRVGVGLSRLLGSRAGDDLGILTYHRVAAHVLGVPKPLHNVDPERFREQLTGLLARGMTVWPLRKVLEYRERGLPIPPRTIVVTFDDGFETVYSNAWPVLQELQIPATVFVNTAYLDSEFPFPFDDWGVAYQDRVPGVTYRPLSMEQCREMIADGLIELGAHTHTHEDFRERVNEFRDDLQTSVEIVQAQFGHKDVTFAFPYGSPHAGFANDELAAAAKQTGVICGLTTESVLVDLHSGPFQWGRLNAFPWDTSATLAAKLEGWYSWAPKLRQRISRGVFAQDCNPPRTTRSEPTEENGEGLPPAMADHCGDFARSQGTHS
jgi:peptidoglycan/xylan/chitin deacetylase (PgdA/CDA1 family)